MANKIAVAKLQVNKPLVNGHEVEYAHVQQHPEQVVRIPDGNGHLGFFSLPGEVRNIIMEYALAPGVIDLHGSGPKKQEYLTVTEQGLRRVRSDVKFMVRGRPRLEDFLRELSALFMPQLIAVLPEVYVCLEMWAFIFDLIGPALNHLLDWLFGRASKQASWPDIWGPTMNRIIDWAREGPTSSIPEVDNRPVPQLLATCHRAYLEGHFRFYNHNTVFLPRGPIEITDQYFENLRLQHKHLMQSIGIRLGFADITVAFLEKIERYAKGCSLNPSSYNARLWSNRAAALVTSIWTAKLVFVRSFTTLKRVRLEARHGSLDLDGGELQQSLKGILGLAGWGVYEAHDFLRNECSEEVWDFVNQAWLDIRDTLHDRVRRYGWSSTKVWLGRGADGQM